MTEPDRHRRITREFAENGMKRLLTEPANVRDLLRLGARDIVEWLDFDRMSVVSGEFIDLEYRRRESDVLLTAPLRGRAGESDRQVFVYVLIEHQSKPDRLMPLRLLRYVLKVFDRQEEEWVRKGKSLRSLALQPVLPVVFYTGSSPWKSVGRLVDLIEAGDAFTALTPEMKPVYISLEALPAEQLESEGGLFGQVLRMVKERRAGTEEFRRLLVRVVEGLGEIATHDRARWLEFLSYLHALVYHRREPAEVPVLEQVILSSGRTIEQHRELSTMAQTYAEYLERKGLEKGLEQGLQKGVEQGVEQGELHARRAILLRHLLSRFGEVPAEIGASIEKADDTAQLDRWLDRVLDATSIADVGID